jgi:hypothetical protein
LACSSKGDAVPFADGSLPHQHMVSHQAARNRTGAAVGKVPRVHFMDLVALIPGK